MRDVGHEHPHAAGIGDHTDAVAVRKRLLDQERGGLGHLGRAAAGDHPRLGEQGVDPDGGSGGAPAADHGEERLALGKAPGRPGELEGVAERLEMQRGDGDLVVVHPGREEVVARHVELGAQRHERVDTDPMGAGDVQQGEADAARLRGDGQPTGSRQATSDGGVESHSGSVAQDALRVRPDQTHAVGACQLQQVAAYGAGLAARAGNPGGDHDGGADARRGRVGHHLHDLVARHHDHHQVDRLADRGEAPVCGQVSDRVGLRVDEVEAAGEPARANRLEDTETEASPIASYADNGDALGIEQRAQRTCLGTPLASVRGVDRGSGGIGAQLDQDLAVLGTSRLGEARTPEHAQHPVVVGEHLGLEAAQAVRAPEGRKVLEQQAAQAAAPILVGHQERDLGVLGGQQLGRREGRDPSANHRHQGHRFDVGVVEQVRHVGAPGSGARREEAHPEGVLRDALVQGQHLLLVVGAQGADHGDRAVGKEDIGGGHGPVPRRDRGGRRHRVTLRWSAIV